MAEAFNIKIHIDKEKQAYLDEVLNKRRTLFDQPEKEYVRRSLRHQKGSDPLENFSDIKEISLVLPNDAEELDWTAENDIKEMCEDSWRWQKNNPNGYEGEE